MQSRPLRRLQRAAAWMCTGRRTRSISGRTRESACESAIHWTKHYDFVKIASRCMKNCKKPAFMAEIACKNAIHQL